MSGGEKTTLLLLTGPTGSGKTSLCLQLAEQARAKGQAVGGLLSPPVFTGGRKAGIALVNLATGERCRLASLRGPEASTSNVSGDEVVSYPEISDWQFHLAALNWGNRILQNLTPCDVLILDELGPLEFQRGEGFQAAFRLITARQYGLACVVVRPDLISQAQGRWPWGRVVDITRIDLPTAMARSDR